MSDRLNVIDTIAKQDKFSTFTRLIATSGAKEAFSGSGDITVFVPTNDAFIDFPDARMSELLNEPNQTKLKALLSYHVLPGKVMAANIGATPTRTSFTGEELAFADTNGLKVNGAMVQARNIEASNGVVHAIDTFLTPPTVTAETVAAAVATSSTGAVAPVVPSVADPVTATSIPTPPVSGVLSVVPTSPAAAAERADLK